MCIWRASELPSVPEVPPAHGSRFACIISLRNGICRAFLEFHRRKEQDREERKEGEEPQANKRRSLGVGLTLVHPTDDSCAMYVCM